MPSTEPSPGSGVHDQAPWPDGPMAAVRHIEHLLRRATAGRVPFGEVELDRTPGAGCQIVDRPGRAGVLVVEEALATAATTAVGRERLATQMAQAVARELVRSLPIDGDDLVREVAMVFGSKFSVADVRSATDHEPVMQLIIESVRKGRHRVRSFEQRDLPVARRAAVVFESVQRQLLCNPRDGLAEVLAEAWLQGLAPSDRPDLVRSLSAIVDGRSGAILRDDQAASARAALSELMEPRGLRRAPSHRDETGHPHALERLAALRAHPDQVPGTDGPDPDRNDTKRELFRLLQLFTNLVNEDVIEYIASGANFWEGVRFSHPPFQPATSRLSDPGLQRAVARAAHLIRLTPSGAHDAAVDGAASDLEVVLGNIALGYGTVISEQHTIDAARDLVLSIDPSISPDALRDILLRSKALAVQKAGLHIGSLDLAREALSLPEEDEGTYEPVTPGTIHPSNLRYDPALGRVTYRKQLSQLRAPKSTELYLQAWTSAERDDPNLRVMDFVLDDMGATVVLACPALTPLDRGSPAPLFDQWERLIDRNHRRWVERSGQLPSAATDPSRPSTPTTKPTSARRPARGGPNPGGFFGW